MEDALRTRISEIIHGKPVVLFMKGTKSFPQCGFSATVVEVLRRSGLTDFQTVNILEDAEIRQGMKEFSNWPTFPQLYVNGEFIGGCDIVRDMFEKNELAAVLEPVRAKS
jgi:monothiol glutaredoxin